MKREILREDMPKIKKILSDVFGKEDYIDIARMGGLTNHTYKITMDDNNEYALQIRQTTSAITYGAIILPVISLIKGFVFSESRKFTGRLFVSESIWLLPTIAFAVFLQQ